MAKYVKTYADFIKEAAEWDNIKKKKIDGRFVSFDKDEAYEPEYFVNSVLPDLKKQTGKEITKDELINLLKSCKEKVPHNHPRKALLKCVYKHYGLEITD